MRLRRAVSVSGKRTLGELINLKRFRKRVQRDRASLEADANRIKFGRTKAQRDLIEQENKKRERSLDEHRRERGRDGT
jgi:hypothetical protein